MIEHCSVQSKLTSFPLLSLSVSVCVPGGGRRTNWPTEDQVRSRMEDGLQRLATQALARLVENIDSYNFVSNDSEWQEVWRKDYDDKSGTCSLCGAMGELDFLQALSCVSRDLATAVRNVLSELSKSATEQAYHPEFQSWVAQLCPGAMAGAKQLFTEKSAAVAMCCFRSCACVTRRLVFGVHADQ